MYQTKSEKKNELGVLEVVHCLTKSYALLTNN